VGWNNKMLETILQSVAQNSILMQTNILNFTTDSGLFKKCLVNNAILMAEVKGRKLRWPRAEIITYSSKK
jgi:hypothetical protein